MRIFIVTESRGISHEMYNWPDDSGIVVKNDFRNIIYYNFDQTESPEMEQFGESQFPVFEKLMITSFVEQPNETPANSP